MVKRVLTAGKESSVALCADAVAERMQAPKCPIPCCDLSLPSARLMSLNAVEDDYGGRAAGLRLNSGIAQEPAAKWVATDA